MSRRDPGPSARAVPATISVAVRGELTVRRADDPPDDAVPLRPKERAVLAAIALAHPQPVGIDRIVALVWGDAAPVTARKTVQNHIVRIRRAIDGLVDTSELGYRFANGVEIDRLTVSGSGVPLADLPDSPEIDAHRQRIHTQVVAAEEEHWAIELDAAATPELVGVLHAAAHTEPYRERRWHLLASAHAALGARREALQVCSRARRHLAEIGLVPGDALRALEQQLLRDEPVELAAGNVRPVVHPYRTEPFVGRTDELARLAAAWDRASIDGRPQLVVVQGPAGSGKTRLVDEFCRGLPDDAVVLVARHRADGDQALAPVVDALRPVREPTSSDGGTPSARALVGALRSTLQLLADRPHVVVLDDVHWASSDAIEVVRAALDGVDTPTLLLATARPTTAGSGTWLPLAAIVPVHHLTVGELSRSELGALVAAAGLDSPPDVDLVYARTAGLPFYASELLRVARLAGRLDVLDVPSAVRTWMQHRLSSLDEDAAEIARTAAVAGPAVATELLEHATGRAPGDVERCCDRLVAAGVLTADADTGTLRFSHELSRDAIVESIGPATLAGLHRRIAEVLAGRAEPALVAHHLVRSGPAAADAAAAASIEAGRRDLQSGAWRQAESWFRSALTLTTSDAARADALAGLGRALVGSERFDESEASLREAIDLARELGLATVQASATIALAGRAGRGGGVATADAEITSLLRSALDHLERVASDDDTERERAVLTSALERELAIQLLLDDAAAERVELLDRQLARVRSLDPPAHEELAAALLASRYAHLDGPGLPQRLADVDEVLALPAAAVGPERLLTAHCYRHEDLLRAGDLGRAAAALADAEGLVRRFPHPYWQWVTRTWRAVGLVVAGDLDGAEELAFEAAATRAGIAEAAACFGVNLVNIRLYQGRSDEVLPLLRDAVASFPHIPTYRAVLALCSAEADDADAARQHLRHFTDVGLANLPDDTNRLLGLSVLAHTAARLGDADAGATIAPQLRPFVGQWVVLNCYGGGGAVWGPVDHALARLARLADDADESDRRFDAAARLAAGAPLVVERIRDDRAERDATRTRRRRPANRAAS